MISVAELFSGACRPCTIAVTNHSADRLALLNALMVMQSSESSRSGDALPTAIHGFCVQSYASRLSSGFQRGLRRLGERGFDDTTCAVVKTTSGNRSGITHAGGRYVDAGNPYAAEVIRQMRELGMEPPPLPFILAPGEYTLYHEWGHYVDHSWSGRDRDVTFSFRWLSRFYKLCVLRSRSAHADHPFIEDKNEFVPIESGIDAADAVVLWRHASSEVFADLFEDWMRGEKKVNWDVCEARHVNRSEPHGHPSVRIAFLPGVNAEDVRAETNSLFAAGIRAAIELPPVRPGLFGPNTDKVIGDLRQVLARARAGRW